MSSDGRRLHPADVVFQVLGALRQLLVPLVLAVLLGAGGSGSGGGFVYGLAGVGFVLAVGIARWSATRYAAGPEGLRFRSGLLSPDETLVPAARISALDTVQGPLQRLFGIVEVQVQTAGGGGKPEVVLRAVSRAEARALGEALGHPTGERPPPAWRLGPRRLVLAAVTAPQVGVLLPALGAAVAAAQDVLDTRAGRGLLDRAPDTPGQVLLVVAVLAAAALAVSVAGAIVAFAGFEVVADGERLSIRRGLLQRRAASVPVERVHAVSVVESPARQPLGLVTVRLETAGYREGSAATRTLLPLATRDEAAAVLGRLLPALAGAAGPLQRPPRRARRRYLTVPVLAAAVPAAVLAALVPAAWPGSVALLALAAGLGALRHADAGWRLEGGRLVVRQRRLARATLVARAAKLQAHAVARTPLQRRAGLARFAVVVGSGRRAHVAHLEAAVADALFARLRPSRRRAI